MQKALNLVIFIENYISTMVLKRGKRRKKKRGDGGGGGGGGVGLVNFLIT